MAHHPFLTREFLTAVCTAAPDVELVAVCSNATELDAAITAWRPDVVLTDIRIPPSGAHDGIRVATRLRDTNPETGVVVLSQYADPSCALGLFERGTRRRAYLLTERIRNREELVEAIQTVAKGGSVIDPLIVDMLIQARSRASHSQLSELTPREREVLAEIGAGKTNGAIAESLVLTKRAVEKHVNSIFSKLDLPESPDVSRRVQATLLLLSEEEDEAAMWKRRLQRDAHRRYTCPSRPRALPGVCQPVGESDVDLHQVQARRRYGAPRSRPNTAPVQRLPQVTIVS